MTTPFIFPALPGQGWSVHKKPTFLTRVASHVSGREVRAPFMSQGLYEFDLTFEGLDSNGAYPGLMASSLQSLMGLYIQCQGQFGTFLYVDPTDNTEVGQLIGTGNGTTTAFTLQRNLNYALEPISWTTGVSRALVAGVEKAQFSPQEDGSTGSHYITRNFASNPAGTQVSLSAYLKAGARSAVALELSDGTNLAYCEFNLATGVKGVPAGGASASITFVGSGWYLCFVTWTTIATGALTTTIAIENPFGTATYTGTIGNGVLVSSASYSLGNSAPVFLQSGWSVLGTTLAAPLWTITQPNTLTFATAPAAAASVAADFSYAFNCRFLDDQEDFEEIMNGLWQVQSVKFRSVKS